MPTLAIATIKGAHGVRGELRVDVYNPESPLWHPGQELFIQRPEGLVRYVVRALRPANLGYLLTLDHVTSREAAQALFGLDLLVDRTALPEPDDPDTHYVSDLLGAEVVEEASGRVYGRVADMLPSAGHDSFVVRDEAGIDAFIPAVHPIVTRFALDEGRIYVALPAGLWELYHEG